MYISDHHLFFFLHCSSWSRIRRNSPSYQTCAMFSYAAVEAGEKKCVDEFYLEEVNWVKMFNDFKCVGHSIYTINCMYWYVTHILWPWVGIWKSQRSLQAGLMLSLALNSSHRAIQYSKQISSKQTNPKAAALSDTLFLTAGTNLRRRMLEKIRGRSLSTKVTARSSNSSSTLFPLHDDRAN